MLLKTLSLIFFASNFVVFMMMMLDKWYAKNEKWRISENMLLSFSIVGGGIGIALGMICFKHKLSKLKFRVISTISSLFCLSLFLFLVFTDRIILILK